MCTSLVLVAALFLFIGSQNKPTEDRLILTAEDREQQRYDSQQEEQARNTSSQIQNAPFLLRKGSDSEAGIALSCVHHRSRFRNHALFYLAKPIVNGGE